jgi:hypothetical protein
MTDTYFEVVEYFAKLPASMQLGLCNTEVIESEPIKHTSLSTKLINGDYHTAQSKSDINQQHKIPFLMICQNFFN